MNDYSILIGIGCFFAGLLIAYWVKGRIMTQKIKAAESEAARFTEDSKKQAETILREADLEVKDRLLRKENTTLHFISRPKISYSLRAGHKSRQIKGRPMFALVDIIDDDPANRWLSICFYVDTVTDPEGFGNLIPEGILGEDGYCFDLFEYDESMISYIGGRIDEAYANFISQVHGQDQ